MLATFTFGDALITVLELALLFFWIWIAVGVVFDIFRSSDLSNWAKASWMLLIIVFPLIGVLIYLVVRGHTMHEHQLQDRARLEVFSRFPSGGAPSSAVDDLTRLAELREKGALTEEEFERAKTRALQ
ncbi:MAG TPA: SHOCT domain-containing protein [Solirubrobacteraceae bacterium]|jgi:hypothetical protein